MITSFHGAVPMLERETGRPWAAVAQGVKADRFAPVPGSERGIALSSYGRRLESVHEGLEHACDGAGLYYDATVAASVKRSVPPSYLYKQYAWHLRHSWFTVAWPVELTSPARAGGLSPMTCRWFEAASAGTTIVGRPPADPIFEELFGEGAVVPLESGGALAGRGAGGVRRDLGTAGGAPRHRAGAAGRAARALDVGGAGEGDARAGGARIGSAPCAAAVTPSSR